MNKTLNVGTVFSGIGSFEQALGILKIPFNTLFACDNGERELPFSRESLDEMTSGLSFEEKEAFIKKEYDNLRTPNYVKKTYFANYPIQESRWHEDIRFLSGKQCEGRLDLFVGGSPCQSFSNMGKRGGLEDARGTLFFEYARLIKEIKPRVFIFENVPGMLNHDHGNTWKTIKDIFDSLGYSIHYKVLNSVDYGLPQNRRRLFVVGFLEKDIHFSFPEPMLLEKTMFDYLEKTVDPKHYLGKKGFEFVTNPFYSGRARINQPIIRTQKANQQFNWNGDFVFEPLEKVKDDPRIMCRAYVGQWNGQTGVCRQLSHRECFRLMGYPDSFKIVVPNVPAYRQAGNSIAVNVMVELVKAILNTGVFSK